MNLPKAAPATTSEPACRGHVLDWMETQRAVMGFWLDQLIAEGDEGEMITMLHRQQCWLEMMQTRLEGAG